MDENTARVDQFEARRGRLKAVASRVLGSSTEADDAVQETWIRFSRSDTSSVDDLTPPERRANRGPTASPRR